MSKKIKLEKFNVCTDCLSVGITDVNCRCVVDSRYKTIELEFEVCTCCDNLIDDGNPPKTPFNDEQIKTLNE